MAESGRHRVTIPGRRHIDPALTGVLRVGYERALRPLLFRTHHGDPEAIHEAMIAGLAALPRPAVRAMTALTGLTAEAVGVEVSGIRFRHRVGLAAGLDKDGHAIRAWAGLGFAFVELGTVTPRPQPGNERPRLFRLPRSRAVINRMGFNNAGAPALAQRLAHEGIWRGNDAAGLPIGISIGKNRTTDLDRAQDDYLQALRTVAPHADYVAINVSSPNTPGLRRLQDADQLRGLVAALVEEASHHGPRPLPVWVKLAPDLSDQALDELVDVCEDAGASALVATNTTLSRDGIAAQEAHLASEAGGLSGAPLTLRARKVVSRVSARSSLPVVGVGGIMSGEDARAMVEAGAALVQLYTGFIYGGPALVRSARVAGEAPRTGRTAVAHPTEDR